MGLVLQCTPLEVLPSRWNAEKEGDPLAPFEIDDAHIHLNPIFWWRAALFVEKSPHIDHRIALDFYIAAGRPEPDDEFDQRIVQEIQAFLPEGVYEEIMARPVPMSLLNWLIQHIDAGEDLHQAVWHLPEEIDAGTVRWSQELKRIGVNHPDYRRAVKAASQTLTFRYGPYLCSYAAFQEHPYDLYDRRKKAFIMIEVERYLYAGVEKGIERDYGRPIAILTAALMAEIASDEVIEEIAQEHPDDDYCQHQVRFHVPREKRLQLARELSNHEVYRRSLRFAVSQEDRFAQMQCWCAARGMVTPRIAWEDALPLLRRLCGTWDQLPKVCPLID
jgi:hypothetical protein